MKNLVLNNYTARYEMEDDLKRVLQRPEFSENQEIWEQFQKSYWPENRVETLKRLYSLQKDDNIITSHTFIDFQQFEIMVDILMNKRMQSGINVYIMNPVLDEYIQKYFDKYESDITPDTDDYNDSPDLREFFKKEMNQKVIKCFEKHNIFWLSPYKDLTRKLLITEFTMERSF